MAYVKCTGRLKSALHHLAIGKGGKDCRKIGRGSGSRAGEKGRAGIVSRVRWYWICASFKPMNAGGRSVRYLYSRADDLGRRRVFLQTYRAASLWRHCGPRAKPLFTTANSLPRLARPYRIGWQWVDVHLGMTDHRNSLLDRLGPDKAVAL